MNTPRISASSYSNTAPLVWSFLYGREHGRVEIILDNAPARSAELLAQDRVDAALVPVIAYQMLDGVRLIPDVCVGAKEKVRSVCLVTRGRDLEDVRSVALDVSSRTSVVLTKIIFREFIGREPEWLDAAPDVDAMLAEADAALIIGDPALAIADRGSRIADSSAASSRDSSTLDVDLQTSLKDQESAIRNPQSPIRAFDLANLWNAHTGLGFIFAMWMTRREKIDIDFAAARDEGLVHIDDIAANYADRIGLSRDEMRAYLTENISFAPDESMMKGMELYFKLAQKNGLLTENKPLVFL